MKKVKKLLLTAALAATMAVGAIVPAVTASATTYRGNNVDIKQLKEGDVIAKNSKLKLYDSCCVVFCDDCKVVYIAENITEAYRIVGEWGNGPHKDHPWLRPLSGSIASQTIVGLQNFLQWGPYTVIGEDGVVPHKHSFSTDWTITDDGHYHACTANGCSITEYATDTTEGIAYAQHEYTNYENEVHKCVCGKEDPANTHTYDETTHKCDCGKVDPNYNPKPTVPVCTIVKSVVATVFAGIVAVFTGLYWIGRTLG